MRRILINVTTNGDGDGTGYGEAVAGTLYAVQLVDGDFSNGVDITLTAEVEGLSIPLLVAADWDTDKMVYPRVLLNLNTDGTAITGQYAMPVVFGRIKAVIAQGGATKTGAVVLYVIEM